MTTLTLSDLCVHDGLSCAYAHDRLSDSHTG